MPFVKNFGGVQALRGANLDVRRGEIMGLCGESGAGKSTLLKVLSGAHSFGSYSGDVRVGGTVQRLLGPDDNAQIAVTVLHSGLDVTNDNPSVDVLNLPVDSTIAYSPTVRRTVHHVQLVGS